MGGQQRLPARQAPAEHIDAKRRGQHDAAPLRGRLQLADAGLLPGCLLLPGRQRPLVPSATSPQRLPGGRAGNQAVITMPMGRRMTASTSAAHGAMP